MKTMYQFTIPAKSSFLVPIAAIMGLLTLTGGSAPSARAQIAAKTPVRVAVFAEKTFPTYGFDASVTPQQIARDLRATGLGVELLEADALSQQDRFDAKRYAALILPYGNAYPYEAFANLRRFHQAGGSLITTGVPFTHPMARIAAQNWSATPVWGASVRLVRGAGPGPNTNAIQLIGDRDRWIGVASAHFAVRSGDAVRVSASLSDVTPPGPEAEASANRDELFVRFFAKDGTFLRQESVTLTPPPSAWREFQVSAATPPNAAAADVSVQVRRGDRHYLAGNFRASVNDKEVALPNADFYRRDDNIWIDLGHTDDAARWSANGIGVGGFAGPKSGASVTISPADPWRLKGVIKPAANPRPAPQWIDPAAVPKGVLIEPALGDATRPIAALIVHTGDAFAGAVDAWTHRGYAPDRDDYETRQIIARATVAALTRRGRLDAAQYSAALRGLDDLPSPPQYTNLILPKIPRRYATLQPKMPALARHLYVADVRKLSPDEKLLLISLQGIVNRKQPRLYLLFDDDDALWLREMQKQKATDAPIAVADPFALLTKFRADYQGAVVCDPKIYDSPCVAVALAGTDDLVIAKTSELAARLHLPVKTDLRGKFRDNADALRYVRTQILPRLDPYLSCSLDPLRYDAGGLDHIIAARGSAFWITGPKSQNLPGANQEAEKAEVRQWLSRLPLGAVVRGFWWDGDGMGMDEEAGVAMGSRFGKVTLVSDLITNLSVHSGVKAEKLTQRPLPPAPPLDRSKVYLSFTMSDGDNLCTWRGYFRRYFDDPVRGTLPVGWGMGPGIIDLAPVWAKWYYDAATPNDEFICDVSGAAYIYPPDWGLALKDRPQALRQFYGLTETYMRRMEMKTIRLMNVDAPAIAQVGTLLPQVDFLMPDYGHAGGETYTDLTYALPTGQPVFRAITSGSGPENLAAQIRKRAGTVRPAFVNAFIWNWGSTLSDLKKTMELLGPDYIAVLPSHLNALYRATKAR